MAVCRVSTDYIVTVCGICYVFFFFKQKTAYEMRISDWSSDVCSSDLQDMRAQRPDAVVALPAALGDQRVRLAHQHAGAAAVERDPHHTARRQIGRASCRERVCQYV